MISFSLLSSLARSIFALLAFILCLINIFNIMIPVWKKRYLFSIFAFILFIFVYLMWQVIFDYILHMRLDFEISAITKNLINIKYVWWIVVIIILTILSTTLLIFNIRFEKNNITLGSIKLYLDKIPCGVCCFKNNGQVIFSNVCMNTLCYKLTNSQLLNGNAFYNLLSKNILDIEGEMWKFSHKDIVIGGEKLHELIASNITTEYAKTKALEKDKTELDRVNKELREYTQSMDDIVKKQEILKAKINIHDEMNRLMLTTMAANCDDEKLNNIFSMWEQNTLLLCMQAESLVEKKEISKIEELASALKLKLIWQGEIPNTLTEDQEDLLYLAIKEAITNAKKHAKASKITISINEEKNKVICKFINDYKQSNNSEIKFTGGLLNLENIAKQCDAKLFASIEDKFVLSLIFYESNKPKERC